MDAASLIPLPVFDAVAQEATAFLLRRLNIAVVAPPGAGTSALALRIQEKLSAAKVPCVAFDCCGEGALQERLAAFTGLVPGDNQPSVISIDHAASLSADQFQAVAARMHEVTKGNPPAFLWLGALDARTIKAATAIELHTDSRTHLCLPELSRDDLLRLYREIADRHECQWGEAMLYFALDWCGNDLSLAEGLAQHFYGNWRERVYDESVAECLANWLAEDQSVKEYRQRLKALPVPCQNQLRHIYGGGKLLFHRPEIHLETSGEIRRLFLDGFLCSNHLPGYYQFRNLLAWFLVEEQAGAKPASVVLLRRSANARVNALLQDIEVSLRAMLRTAFRQMSLEDVRTLLKARKTEQKLYEPGLQTTLLEWTTQVPVVAPFNIKESLGKLLKEERAKFEMTSNLWTKVCHVFQESFSPENPSAEPTPEQTIGCLTFSELSDLFQSLADKVFLEKARSSRIVDSPKKRWPEYLAKVRRLRNEAAHLRNIGFQDIEDLLQTLEAIRQDQSDFSITP